MASFFREQRQPSMQDLLRDVKLTPSLQAHLSRVYATLALTLAVTVVGVIAHLYMNLGGILSSIATLMLMVWLGVDQDKTNYTKRLAIIGGVGFFQGLSLGPLMAYAIHVDPSIIVTALMGTLCVFTCFSISAMFARRTQMLALGGILSSGISFLFVLSFVNMFFRSSFIFSLYLYIGLFVFCGYVLFDTQLIIERHLQNRDNDYVQHAVELFVDFVGIFVRLVVILLDKHEKKEKRKERR